MDKATIKQEHKERVPIKCLCGKRIADRDTSHIYIYCRKCKRVHEYKIIE